MVNLQPLIKNMPHIIALVVLIFILLFILANFGYIRPCDIPGFSGIYYAIKGYPRVAIVSNWETDLSDDIAGVGDPEALRSVIIERTHFFPDRIYLENLMTGGVLDQYQLVIVERAKKIDTATLQAFKDYVQKGGKLVWIGDAGTGLGDNDYICQQVTFAYLPAAEVAVNETDTITTCAEDWLYITPNDPETIESGICGKDFAEIVMKFVEINQTTYEDAFDSGLFPCPDVDEAFQVRGAERIEACLNRIPSDEAVTRASVEEFCAYSSDYRVGVNYWNRGATETETGRLIPKFNFGSVVIGLDFVAQTPGIETNIFFQPVDANHRLIRGYGTRTNVTEWFGTAPLSIVDTTGYEMRTSSILNVKYGTQVFPGIVVSSPVGPLLTKTGLIIYYAFPPEIGVESGGRGLNLIDNLFDFVICV